MREHDLANDLKAAICHLNPNLDKTDLRYNVATKHLLNKIVNECSSGMFGRHPRATDELIERCRSAEEFIESLMSIQFEIPTGDELLRALREVKNVQPKGHIYAEQQNDD